MKTNGNDILSSHPELKKNPFGAPEGYFETFKVNVTSKAVKPQATPWRRSIPYIAVAASLALLISVGSFISNRIQADNGYTDEDYILSSSFISIAEYENEDSYQFAEAEIMNEDIIEYLIYLGISPESIELSK